MPETCYRFGHHFCSRPFFIFRMELPFCYFREINIKKTRGRIVSQRAYPAWTYQISVFYLPLCVSCSSPKIRSSISGRSGCWGMRKRLMCFHLLCFILCYSISSYAKKATKILVKLHKCNNLTGCRPPQGIKIPRPADAARLVTCTIMQVGFLFGVSALPTSVYTREACCSTPKLSEIPY